jgi:hypothetical protein
VPIFIEVGGTRYDGHYQTDRGMIRVSYKWNSKTAQLHASAVAPAGLAKLILSELVRETPD